MKLRHLLLLSATAAGLWHAARQRRRAIEASVQREERLDEGLDESFPASDPPSMTNPSVGCH